MDAESKFATRNAAICLTCLLLMVFDGYGYYVGGTGALGQLSETTALVKLTTI